MLQSFEKGVTHSAKEWAKKGSQGKGNLSRCRCDTWRPVHKREEGLCSKDQEYETARWVLGAGVVRNEAARIGLGQTRGKLLCELLGLSE